MDRTCLNKEQVILMDGHLLQVSHHRAVRNGLADFFLCAVLLESIDQLCIPSGIQHIPHLGLAQLAVLVLLCVGVGGMHLYRQVFLGIDEFDKDRQRIFALMTLAQILRMCS